MNNTRIMFATFWIEPRLLVVVDAEGREVERRTLQAHHSLADTLDRAALRLADNALWQWQTPGAVLTAFIEPTGPDIRDAGVQMTRDELREALVAFHLRHRTELGAPLDPARIREQADEFIVQLGTAPVGGDDND